MEKDEINFDFTLNDLAPTLFRLGFFSLKLFSGF